jgi:hypothetical protein
LDETKGLGASFPHSKIGLVAHFRTSMYAAANSSDATARMSGNRMNFCRARGILRGPGKADLPHSARTSLTAWSIIRLRRTPAVESDERDANDPLPTSQSKATAALPKIAQLLPPFARKPLRDSVFDTNCNTLRAR